MIRIAIVEDEKFFRDQLISYFEDFRKECRESIELTVYTDGDEILQKYRSQFDIILMDIQMKLVDGMTAAEEIRKVDSEVVLLFITNLAQYAIRGYEVRAFDYILKPLSYFAFAQKITKAMETVRRKEKQYVSINIRGGVLRMESKDLYYIESAGHDLVYHTSKGNYEGSGTMKQAEEDFKPFHFSRGNKGYLINLDKVQGIREKCAIVNGEELPISRNRYEAFMKDMTNYWSEVE